MQKKTSELGTVLRNARVSRRVTLRELSEHTGEKISFLAKIEQGEFFNPSYETCTKIEHYLGLKAGTLTNLVEKFYG